MSRDKGIFVGPPPPTRRISHGYEKEAKKALVFKGVLHGFIIVAILVVAWEIGAWIGLWQGGGCD